MGGQDWLNERERGSRLVGKVSSTRTYHRFIMRLTKRERNEIDNYSNDPSAREIRGAGSGKKFRLSDPRLVNVLQIQYTSLMFPEKRDHFHFRRSFAVLSRPIVRFHIEDTTMRDIRCSRERVAGFPRFFSSPSTGCRVPTCRRLRRVRTCCVGTRPFGCLSDQRIRRFAKTRSGRRNIRWEDAIAVSLA